MTVINAKNAHLFDQLDWGLLSIDDHVNARKNIIEQKIVSFRIDVRFKSDLIDMKV